MEREKPGISFVAFILFCVVMFVFSPQMSFPANMPMAGALPMPPPLPTVKCEFHRDFRYTDEGFHQEEGLGWHFEDSHRCIKVHGQTGFG